MILNIRVLRYKEYKIWKDSNRKSHTEKGFGHTWYENIPINKYYIVGLGVSCIRRFGSIKKCKEHIDFLIRNNLNRDYTQLEGL